MVRPVSAKAPCLGQCVLLRSGRRTLRRCSAYPSRSIRIFATSAKVASPTALSLRSSSCTTTNSANLTHSRTSKHLCSRLHICTQLLSEMFPRRHSGGNFGLSDHQRLATRRFSIDRAVSSSRPAGRHALITNHQSRPVSQPVCLPTATLLKLNLDGIHPPGSRRNLRHSLQRL
jgi:hypothetical protein